MIASKDRSGYIGASDVDKVIGNWKTKSWFDWWLTKIGIARNNFTNEFMLAGTYLEHRILSSLHIYDMEFDKQFIDEELLLRVNLDGNTDAMIYECKTTSKSLEDFKLPKKYNQQVQVQMFISGIHKTKIVVYSCSNKDYKNYFLPIDDERIKVFDIDYDKSWIEKTYLPKHLILRDCLLHGTIPDEARELS